MGLKGWHMFNEIKNMKELGLKKSQVSRYLDLDYGTVSKYWNMQVKEFAEYMEKVKVRKKILDEYEDEIVGWLRDFPDMSAAQILDWLKERYGDIKCTDRSVRNYVRYIRDKYDIPKVVSKRQHEAVQELPMGYQAQVDFGQIWLNNADGKRVKLYAFAMVLSHSRMKYAYWQNKPFTTKDFIDAHTKAFEYFGGKTHEIVYDQDRLLAVNENYGDIIFTEEFQNFKDFMKIRVRMCRGYDPESKGKIEAVVKYLKYNFAKNRTFVDIDKFNEDCLLWLDRTGNANIHGTTKKIPKEVFSLEKKYLLPVSQTFRNVPSNSILTYTVRKDNTISYKQNRYQVPKGTYEPGKTVGVRNLDGIIQIIDKDTGKILAEHNECTLKGKLIQIDHPERDKTLKIDKLYEKALNVLNNTNEAKIFLDRIRIEKPRYIRDQYSLICNTCKNVEKKLIEESLKYCIEREIFSAVSFRDTIEFLGEKYKELENQKTEETTDISTPSIPQKYDIKTQIRDTSEYVKALEG